MELYLNTYHKLLLWFYNANKLQINGSKTTFMVTRRPAKEKRRLRIHIENEEPVIESNAMKILGIWRNNRNSMDTHLGKVSAISAKALEEIRPLLRHMNMKTRKEVVDSKCNSILTYGIEPI